MVMTGMRNKQSLSTACEPVNMSDRWGISRARQWPWGYRTASSWKEMSQWRGCPCQARRQGVGERREGRAEDVGVGWGRGLPVCLVPMCAFISASSMVTKSQAVQQMENIHCSLSTWSDMWLTNWTLSSVSNPHTWQLDRKSDVWASEQRLLGSTRSPPKSRPWRALVPPKS